MDTIGEILKNARLDRGLTLEELQQQTKIQKKYLAAIEANDFEALPGTYYVRTFIKQYALAVNEDGEKLVRRFDGKKERIVIPETVKESRTELYKESETVKKIKAKLPLFVLSTVVIVIVGAVMYATFKESSTPPVISRPKQVEVETQTPSLETKLDENQNPTETITDSSQSATSNGMETLLESEENGESTIAVKNVTNPITLTFEGVDERCWIGVMSNGEYVYQYTISDGETAETSLPENSENATLILGASGNVQVKVNGEILNFNPNDTGSIKRTITLNFAYKN